MRSRPTPWLIAFAVAAFVAASAVGCGDEDFDPDTDPKNPNCGETSEECG